MKKLIVVMVALLIGAAAEAQRNAPAIRSPC
mgnify:CR=1 FL=1